MEKKTENANSEMSEVDVDIDFGDETDVEAIKARAKEVLAEKVGKVTETNKQLYARTKKAEGFELKDGKWVKTEKPTEQKPEESKSNDDIPQKDFLILSRSSTHEDDFERVIKFAKDEGISVSDALKNDELKAIIDIRTEKRTSAEVSNTGVQRRITTKVTGEELRNNLITKGEVPEKGSKEAEDLFWSKHKKR
jgi:hypothetical protein